MNDFSALTSREKEQLYKLPVYASLLAANHNGGIDKTEQKAAVKLSHIKTYKCNPVLASFFEGADKVFKQNIEELNEALPKDYTAREQVIKQEIKKLDVIIAKLGPEYAAAMRKGIQSFSNHVARAHNNVFEYILFPMSFKEITE